MNTHMDALIKLPQINSMRNTKGLRKLYYEIETNFRSLKSLGVNSDSFGCLLVPILTSKLPSALNLQLSRKLESNVDVWKVDSIMEELKRELDARERCEADIDRNDGFPRPRGHTTTEALHTGEQVPSCPYCEGKHYPDNCKSVTDVSKGKEILMKKRCFLCPKENHVIKNCFSKRKCFHCKGVHHTSICERNPQRKNDERKEETQVNLKKENKETRSNAALSPGNSIMLQTAQLTVQSNLDKDKGRMMYKVIFDSGSQRSYITKKAARSINARLMPESIIRKD